jgi:hypothetical protein
LAMLSSVVLVGSAASTVSSACRASCTKVC